MATSWWKPYVLIGLGGAVGSTIRFSLHAWIAAAFITPFPLGTLVINVSGSFLIGVVSTILAQRLVSNPDVWRLLVSIGILGGYTTFSTFELESHQLMMRGAWGMMATYMLGSTLGGLAGVRLGVVLMRKMPWMRPA